MIFKKMYFAQCNNGNTQGEKEKSEAKRSNIIAFYY